MKIAVLLKQVPVKDATLRINEAGTWIDEDDISFEINESDHYALEEALRIREKNEGEVAIVAMGPDRTKEAIKQGLAKGADRAVFINTEDYENPDPLTIARILSSTLKDEEFDLILSGLQSDDVGFGATGVLVAELLNFAHASLVMETDIQGDKIRVKRELEGGWFQNVELPLPAVLTIQSGLNEIRYATIKGIMAAKRKAIKEIDVDDLELESGSISDSRIALKKLYVPQKTKKTDVLEGNTDAIVSALMDKLKNEAKVL